MFPYIPKVSEKITSLIDRSKCKIGHRCLNKLNSFIKVDKDKNLPIYNNNVIYKICCNECDASYVRQTKRQRKTRIKEHMHNVKFDPSRHSVVTEHTLEFNHTFDWEDIKILDHEPNFNKRNYLRTYFRNDSHKRTKLNQFK